MKHIRDRECDRQCQVGIALPRLISSLPNRSSASLVHPSATSDDQEEQTHCKGTQSVGESAKEVHCGGEQIFDFMNSFDDFAP